MVRNNTFAATSTTVNAPMFHCASRNPLHARFFCIMSWSSPVMARVTNIPASTCLSQWFGAFQSSVTQTLVRLESRSKAGKSDQLSPPYASMPLTVNTTARSIAAVCRVSVQITVPMPLLRV